MPPTDRLTTLVQQEREDEAVRLSVTWYLFIAVALFFLTMALLATQNLPNAREIARLLDIVPHRPVTMTLMTASLATSLLFAGFAAYPIVWWNGRRRNVGLAGAAAALVLAALLVWSPQVVRLVAPLFAG